MHAVHSLQLSLAVMSGSLGCSKGLELDLPAVQGPGCFSGPRAQFSA